MVGTRTLAPLLQTAATGTKVVLVGDPKQLPEIQVGGVLGSLARSHQVLTLVENRRQKDPTEVSALDQFRTGSIEHAVWLLRYRGGVITAHNAETVREGMAGEWWRYRTEGQDSRMVAKRNADVDDLNNRARRQVAAAGQLSGEPIVIHGRPFQVGDDVLCTRNDYTNELPNGTLGRITHIDHDMRAFTIWTEDGDRRINHEYLDAGNVWHGYAVTVHKAQGRTCDHGLLLASDDMHREMGYVGLSRGRGSNRMYLVSGEPDTEDQLDLHGRAEDKEDPFEIVVDSLPEALRRNSRLAKPSRQSNRMMISVSAGEQGCAHRS